MNLEQVPKIELHLHLDSSLSYDVVQKLDPAITKKEFRDSFVAPAKCHDLKDYLTRVARQVDMLQTRESLKLATEGLLQKLEDDNVIYAEIRFAPLLHTGKGLKPEEIVEVVLDTFEMSSTKTRVNLILCNLRNFSNEQNMQTARLVNQFKNGRVVGLDLAGDEKGFSLKEHIGAYEYALNHGLHRTAHAGEAGGPQSVRETLNLLKPTRIGHGVRSFEDPVLIDLLKEKNVHLEVCPTSNIQTNVYDTYADHTINRLYENGISLGINTDGRTTSNVSLTEEYRKLQETFGWSRKEFLQCNLNAIEAAFISDDKKAKLRHRLKEGYAG